MRIDSVDGSECIKVLAICSQLLNSNDYVARVAKSLNGIFAQPEFDFMAEFGLVVQALIKINQSVEFYKEINVQRAKYVLYAVFYHYVYKNQLNWLNEQNIGTIRLLYSNVYDLLMVKSESLAIAKQGCLSCIGACVPFFKSSKIQIAKS